MDEKVIYKKDQLKFEVRVEVNNPARGNVSLRNIKQLGLFDSEYHALIFADALAGNEYSPAILFNDEYLAKFICKNDPDRLITVSRPGIGISETLEEEVERRR